MQRAGLVTLALWEQMESSGMSGMNTIRITQDQSRQLSAFSGTKEEVEEEEEEHEWIHI